MPELAEAEFFRKRWHQAGAGQRVVAVRLHPRAKIFRGINSAALRRALTNEELLSSETAAKQILFRFAGDAWLGLHLGMTGELRVEAADYEPREHDHLVLVTPRSALVFADPRMFGRVQFHRAATPPGWWTKIAPAILSPAFTVDAVSTFLRRRARAPIKAVLLMQERFPGVGNWMADEILWRAAIHPKRAAGSLTASETRVLWGECRRVCRLALDKIAGRGNALPRGLNVAIPDSWLFSHRWTAGGRCPRTGAPLVREQIGDARLAGHPRGKNPWGCRSPAARGRLAMRARREVRGPAARRPHKKRKEGSASP